MKVEIEIPDEVINEICENNNKLKEVLKKSIELKCYGFFLENYSCETIEKWIKRTGIDLQKKALELIILSAEAAKTKMEDIKK